MIAYITIRAKEAVTMKNTSGICTRYAVCGNTVNTRKSEDKKI